MKFDTKCEKEKNHYEMKIDSEANKHPKIDAFLFHEN